MKKPIKKLTRLKRCPFCGRSGKTLTLEPFACVGGSWTIDCLCGVSHWGPSRAEAIKKWNTRVRP